MERATAPQICKSMEAANVMKNAGIRFIPMTVIDDADHASCLTEMMRRMELIVELTESTESLDN